MTTETKTSNPAVEKEDKRPDFVARQYRYVRLEDGLKLRKETVAVGWFNSANGSITLRPNGMQIIENDIYLFPTEKQDAE
jgi:hypothetical protein